MLSKLISHFQKDAGSDYDDEDIEYDEEGEPRDVGHEDEEVEDEHRVHPAGAQETRQRPQRGGDAWARHKRHRVCPERCDCAAASIGVRAVSVCSAR